MANNRNPLLQDQDIVDSAPTLEQTSSGNPLLEDELAGEPSQNMPDQARRTPTADTSWYDVPGQALKNAPSSALHFAKGMVEPFLSPVETFNSLKDVGSGLASKVSGAFGAKQDPAEKERTESAVNAIGKFYKEKYGSEAGWKEALANDPIGVLGDVSMVLTGGGGLAARAPGLAGKVGSAARTAGDLTNPASFALKAVKPVISTGMKGINYGLALTTGAPIQTLQSALRAGQAGSKGFKEQISGGSMLGHSDPTSIVEAAYDAVKTLKDQRRDNYLNSLEGMRSNQTPLSYNHINSTIYSAYGDVMHGQNVYRPGAKSMLDEISHAVMDWQTTPNALGVNYHNLDGLDKLKQKVGDIRSSAMPGSPEEMVATKVYNSIKDTLVKHDKKYAQAMGDYSDASDLLKQMQKTMSINSQATVDSTLRKLLLGQKQVDGNKSSLLKELNKINPELEYMISGHLLQPIIPVGLRGAINAGIGGLGLYGGVTNPVGAVGHAIASSPRAMGALNYGVGRLTAPGAAIPGSLSTVPASFSEASRLRLKRKEEPSPYYPGEDEEAPPLTIRRARGGKVGHQHLVDRLMRMAEQVKKASNVSTEPLLNAPDEAVIKALDIAQRHI